MQKVKLKQSKAGFIRAQSDDLPAAEIVKKAKAAGITITVHTVHTTRSMARKTGKTMGATTLAGPAQTDKQSDAARSEQQDTQQFVKLVMALGLRRSEEVLAQIREKLASL